MRFYVGHNADYQTTNAIVEIPMNAMIVLQKQCWSWYVENCDDRRITTVIVVMLETMMTIQNSMVWIMETILADLNQAASEL